MWPPSENELDTPDLTPEILLEKSLFNALLWEKLGQICVNAILPSKKGLRV